MTSYSQLDRYGRDIFIPRMKSLGFTHHRNFCFTRVSARGIHNIVTSQILSSKENVKILPHVWVPELDSGVSRYPQHAAMAAQFPSWQYEDWSGTWGIADEAEARNTLASIVSLIERLVIPWFDSIKEGCDLVAAIRSDLVENERMKKIIPEILDRYQ